jgi:hypothetical protein
MFVKESRSKMKAIINKINLKNNWLKILFLVVPWVVLSCSGHHGRLAVNNAVKAQFEDYQVLSDHRYYYSGSVARPRAVIGIHEIYTLKSNLWVPVNLTPDILKGWVDYFGPSTKYFKSHNGSDILAEDGSKIGVWYAFIDWKDWVAVKMIDEKVVSITAPISQEKESMFWGPGFITISVE